MQCGTAVAWQESCENQLRIEVSNFVVHEADHDWLRIRAQSCWPIIMICYMPLISLVLPWQPTIAIYVQLSQSTEDTLIVQLPLFFEGVLAN